MRGLLLPMSVGDQAKCARPDTSFPIGRLLSPPSAGVPQDRLPSEKGSGSPHVGREVLHPAVDLGAAQFTLLGTVL